jgi:hypothetical protein
MTSTCSGREITSVSTTSLLFIVEVDGVGHVLRRPPCAKQVLLSVISTGGIPTASLGAMGRLGHLGGFCPTHKGAIYKYHIVSHPGYAVNKGDPFVFF